MWLSGCEVCWLCGSGWLCGCEVCWLRNLGNGLVGSLEL